MEQLLARLLTPLAVMLALSAIGIFALFIDTIRRRAPVAEAAAGSSGPARSLAAAMSRSAVDVEATDPHDTLVIDRRALRDSMQGLPQYRSRGAAQDLRGPDADYLGASRSGGSPPARGGAPPRPRGDDIAGPGETITARPPSGRLASRDGRDSGDLAGRKDMIDSKASVRETISERDSAIRRRPDAPEPSFPRSGRDDADLGGRRRDIFDPPARPREEAPRADSHPDSRPDSHPPNRKDDVFEAPPRPRPGAGRGDLYDSRSRESADYDAPRQRPPERDIFNPPSRPRESADRYDISNAPTRPRSDAGGRDRVDTPGARESGRDIFNPPSRPRSRDEKTAPPRRPDIFERSQQGPRDTRVFGDDAAASRGIPPDRDSGSLRNPNPRDSLGGLDARSTQSMRGEGRLETVGVNIVLHQPASQRGFTVLPGRLEVIYGNFSPNDPREIPLFWPAGDPPPPCFVFSKSPGEGVAHIQLNHYTITPTAQADLTYENGRHVLGNLVDGEEMDRYQIRVNGVAMGLGERVTLHSGDIISMGIYRLKLIL